MAPALGPAIRRAIKFTILSCVIALTNGTFAAPALGEGTNDAFVSDIDEHDTQSVLRAALSSATKTRVQEFYAARDYEPVWTGNSAAWGRGIHVRSTLEHAYRQGLRSAEYISDFSTSTDPPEQGREAAEYEIAMTDALLRYASDVRTGRVTPKDVYKDVALPPPDFDVIPALLQALKDNEIDTFLADLPPPHPAYQRLVEALSRYRAISALGGWPTVPGRSEIKLDGKDKRRALLARRLAFEDRDLATTLVPSGADLRVAVLRFQRRNGLEDNGKVGLETLKALNVPVSYRMAQIVANMERWRWVPRKFEKRYVVVNVPGQSLDFIDSRMVLLHSRVIIGKKISPTPILRTMAEAVVANPPWNIPDDIAAKKLLPHLRKSPNYLLARNMVLADGPAGDPHGVNINWRRVTASDLPYQIQQPPGPGNVLGVLMLDSPNDFDVYMHDTSDRKLFQSRMREMSNGCIRVKEIFPLASLALTGSSTNGTEELEQSVASGQTQRLSLSQPLPVYMLYWTATAHPDGTVDFRPDRYGRDGPLIRRLTGAQLKGS